MRLGALAGGLFVLTLLAGRNAAAQSNFTQAATEPQEGTGGWVLTPSLAYFGGWDDNVLLLGRGDHTLGDYVSVINPQAHLTFTGRLGYLEGDYSGALLRYRELNTLNSYDQRGSFFGRRLVSKHVALFVRQGFASVPTTELVQLVAVPFVRTGSKIEDFHAGVDAVLGRHTSVSASYNFDWVQFDFNPQFVSVLFGGHSNGASGSLRHQIATHTTLTADGDIEHATVAGLAQVFDIQNATVGIDQRLSTNVHAFGAAGISRLAVSPIGLTRTGPAYRAGLSSQVGRAGIAVLYSRSFVPTFTFGGTTQNEELSMHLSLPLSRRAYTTSSVAWRKNDPLLVGDLSLRSWWVEGTIGYSLRPWMRIQGFYEGTRQMINRPGGILDRNRIGFEIVTTKPMRLR